VKAIWVKARIFLVVVPAQAGIQFHCYVAT
jgi:hypothetical protein